MQPCTQSPDHRVTLLHQVALHHIADPVLHEGAVGLLANQASFDLRTGEYSYAALARRGVLKRIFLPEHGFFGEHQDQSPVPPKVLLPGLSSEIDTVSLYGADAGSRSPTAAMLSDLDALVVDIPDAGSRYYTFPVTFANILATAAPQKLTVYVVDRPNPAGRQVEGTPLPLKFASFVGLAGLPHRHGLTIGELCCWIARQQEYAGELRIITDQVTAQSAQWASGIPGSPNFPGPWTAAVYSGQCLLEGANLSTGRGTTRPFEIFGAPWLKSLMRQNGPPAAPGAQLRPLCFIPAFDRFHDHPCWGWQIHPLDHRYHSLAHTLQLIRWIRESKPNQFAWREGPFEAGSPKMAIELLAGDQALLDYLQGRSDFATLCNRLDEGERQWIASATAGLLYADPLFPGSRSEN